MPTATDLREERVFFRESFYGETFDFRSRILFYRFDACTFVDCTLLIDTATEQVAFTGCTFKDCNIDRIDADEMRGLVVRDNFFDKPIAVRKAEFDRHLAEVLSARRKNEIGSHESQHHFSWRRSDDQWRPGRETD